MGGEGIGKKIEKNYIGSLKDDKILNWIFLQYFVCAVSFAIADIFAFYMHFSNFADKQIKTISVMKMSWKKTCKITKVLNCMNTYKEIQEHNTISH